MAKPGIIRSPDLDSAKREFMTGEYKDKARNVGTKRPMMGGSARAIRSAVGSRRKI